MSTRSEIIIKDYWTSEATGKHYTKKVKLYHHSDGYPEGVGKDLMEFIYPMLTRSNSSDCNSVANKLLKWKDDNGYELTVYVHSDIEYMYVIDIPMKKIFCYEGHYSRSDRFVKTKEIDLDQFLPCGMKQSYA